MWIKVFVVWIIISVVFTLWIWPGIAGMNGEPDNDSISESQV